MSADLTRRLAALEEAQRNRAGYRHVILLGPDDPCLPHSDDTHVIRIVAFKPEGAVSAPPADDLC